MSARAEPEFLGPGDSIAEGDTYVLYDFLPPELAESAFDNLIKEVKWNNMRHRGTSSCQLLGLTITHV